MSSPRDRRGRAGSARPPAQSSSSKGWDAFGELVPSTTSPTRCSAWRAIQRPLADALRRCIRRRDPHPRRPARRQPRLRRRPPRSHRLGPRGGRHARRRVRLVSRALGPPDRRRTTTRSRRTTSRRRARGSRKPSTSSGCSRGSCSTAGGSPTARGSTPDPAETEWGRAELEWWVPRVRRALEREGRPDRDLIARAELHAGSRIAGYSRAQVALLGCTNCGLVIEATTDSRGRAPDERCLPRLRDATPRHRSRRGEPADPGAVSRRPLA